jgi:Kef-type K+ transport system membrane component KefB
MPDHSFVFTIFVIFTSAALLATLVLYTRQSLLVAYILLGILLGPSVFKLVPNLQLAHDIGDVGVIFLLFLLGLDLSPKELLHTLRKTTLVTLISSLAFWLMGFAVSFWFGFNIMECALIGAALIFSSTIIGLKLLPTTVLHHQQTGEIMISVLLLQDIIALALLIFVHGASITGSKLIDLALTVVTLPTLIALAFFVQHFVIAKLFKRFDRNKEYIFLLALGWCLGLAALADAMGLSAEIGAFLAGISIAEGPIAAHIADSLKPLRDFCLVMFFFAVGASFDLHYFPQVVLPAILLAVIVLLVKPWMFSTLFRWLKVPAQVAKEAGVRLGQTSEFSLLIAYLAVESTPILIGERANYLIQALTLITFVVSSYWVVLRYPTPMASSDKLRKD